VRAVQVNLVIYKVSREFADKVGTRHIAQAHLFGTPEYRWFAAESLVELHGRLEYCGVKPMALDWSDVESALESEGGFEISLDLDEPTFSSLFGF
jgi:hypothetical protein